MTGPKPYFLPVKLAVFEHKHAVLTTEDGQSIRWPIKNLPDDAKEGDLLRINISTSLTEQAERKETAREILNQILNE